MKYLKIDKYIVSLDGVHGVLNNIMTRPSSSPLPTLDQPKVKGQIIITYTGGVSACLDFATIEDTQKAFEKIAEALGC